MEYLIKVTADENDADYHTSNTVWSEDEFMENEAALSRIVTAINDVDVEHHYNWPDSMYRYNEPRELYGDKLDESDIQLVESLIPYPRHGIHSIVDIEVFEIKCRKTIYTK